MKTNIKNLQKGEIEIIIELSQEELKPYLERASERLASKTKIEGFRPGKAPYNIVKARFGEHSILEEATEEIVKKSYLQAVKENNLKTIGSPKIDVEKMAINNPFIFKATAAILPATTLGEYKKLDIKKLEAKVEDKSVLEALNNLVKMQSKEILTDKTATKADKVIVDMDMLKDNVPIEGGQGKDMVVYLRESHYILGFNEQLVGVKKGDEKEFDLDFPKEHYQKHLAGAKIHFKVKVKDVYEIQPPKLDDDFAKTLGQDSLEKLTELIKKNLETEVVKKNEIKWEIDILNKIVDNSKFSDIPEILINEEVHRMVHELEDNVLKQGISFEDYLKSINKTESDLKLEFAGEAIKRIKISLVIREIAILENIKASDKEIIEEVERMINAYKDDANAQKQIKTPEFTNYIKSNLENKKVINLIKENN